MKEGSLANVVDVIIKSILTLVPEGERGRLWPRKETEEMRGEQS